MACNGNDLEEARSRIIYGLRA